MTVRCEKDDSVMHKTGELLEAGDGELREELKCPECGTTSAIYYSRDGHEMIEEEAYSDRELDVHFEGSNETVEWEGELTHNSAAITHDRAARGTVTVEGSAGEIIIVLDYRAMLTPFGEETANGYENDLMEPGKIKERKVCNPSSGDPFEQEPLSEGTREWDVSEETLQKPQKFIEKCRSIAEDDLEGEYKQHCSDITNEETEEGA